MLPMHEIMPQMKEVHDLIVSNVQYHSLTVAVAFLSWLRLSVYMAIVSVAIVLSFHLKQRPSQTGKYTFSTYL
jgi:hypothetical protein